MRTTPHSFRRNRAFTRLELFVVISVVAVLLSLLLPWLAKSKQRTSRIKCSFNLKQIVLSAKMFAGDNDGCYPFGTTNSFAYQDTNAAWRHFLTMSNELGSTKILVCHYDQERATNYAAVFGDSKDPMFPSLVGRQNSAVSYFVALRTRQTDLTNHQGVFFGDRNILIPGTQPSGPRLKLSTGDHIKWDSRLHNKVGNIAYADGSVSSLTSGNENTEESPTELLLPVFP